MKMKSKLGFEFEVGGAALEEGTRLFCLSQGRSDAEQTNVGGVLTT
jgi:hypothetical protein